MKSSALCMEFSISLEKESDESVLAASLKKPSLFRVLLERYEAAFLRKAYGVLHDWEDAADVVQETFIRIYKYADTFSKREGIQFKSWAYKILMNTAFTRYTKTKKSAVVSSDFLMDEDAFEHHDGGENSELQDSIRSVIGKMPSHLASVLQAHYLDGKSYEDIVREQNITLAALKMRMFRARQMFKKQFELEASFKNER